MDEVSDAHPTSPELYRLEKYRYVKEMSAKTSLRAISIFST